ncbi:hypothetical protein B0H13DRAFT_2016971 [Mycena leptocephala]|nr:hypothetical protein B0H13DRAFT_2016971 [Mycena leptocephala]
MFGWLHKAPSQDKDAYEQKPHHKAKFTHELMAAAASYEAAKKYEEHCAANGKPDSHAKAKELMAAFSGAFIDRMVESKGLDTFDKEKAKHAAKKRAEEQSEEVMVVEYS